MEKFTKLKDKNEISNGDKEKVLYSGETLKVIEFENRPMIKEKDTVICIPYLIDTNQIILRYEYIPTFKYVDGQEYHVTLVGGGVEIGESPDKAILRELEEEAGIVLREDFKLEKMKELFMTKWSVNKYHPYIMTLTERDFHEIIAPTDGSREELLSKSVKVDVKLLGSLKPSDLITDYMLLRLKEYLNL